MKNKLIITASIAMTAVLTGCQTTTSVPLALQPEEQLESLAGFEDVDFSVSDKKIIVMPGSKPTVPNYLQMTFADHIEGLIREAGSEVIDRQLASKFADEIKLKETMSDDFETYEGPIEAKFAVIPTITNYGYSSSYKKAGSYKNKKGETVRTDPSCSYKSSVSGTVEIRQLPSMRKVLNVSLTGSDYSSQSNPSSSRCKDENMINGTIASSIADLIVKGEDNYLTINKYVGSQGVIIGARKDKDKLYFETNLGRVHGAKEGLPVNVYVERDGELVRVAQGEMLSKDNVLSKKSFIKLDSQVVKIKKGMIVKLSGECPDLLCDFKTAVKDVKTSLQ